MKVFRAWAAECAEILAVVRVDELGLALGGSQAIPEPLLRGERGLDHDTVVDPLQATALIP